MSKLYFVVLVSCHKIPINLTTLAVNTFICRTEPLFAHVLALRHSGHILPSKSERSITSISNHSFLISHLKFLTLIDCDKLASNNAKERTDKS